MACTISFTIGKSEFPSIENVDSKVLWGEGEDLSPLDLFKNIVKVLKKAKIDGDSAYNLLVLAIGIDMDYNLVDFSTEKIDDFDGTSVANANVEYLRTLYPDIDFPTGIETQILVRDLLESNSKKPVVGRVIDERGKEVIILRNNRLSMLRLAKFLKLKQAMQDPEFLGKVPKELITELNEIAKEFKMPSIADLALQFDIDLSTFYDSKFKTSTDRSVVTVLKELQIYASGHTPVRYESKTLNELNRRLKYFEKGAYLDMNNFFDTILSLGEWGEVMKALNIESGQSLVEFFDRDPNEILSDIEAANLKTVTAKFKNTDVLNFVLNIAQNIGKEDIDPILEFFNTLTSLKQIHEPFFAYEVALVNKRKSTTSITFMSIYPTLERSGVGFETLKNFIEIGRKGSYRIYQRTEEDGTKYYYISNHIIGKNTFNRPYLSLQEAEDTATLLMNEMTLEDASLSSLRSSFNDEGEVDDDGSQSRTFELDYLIPEDTIVEILPFNINKNGMLAKEYMLFGKTLNAFYDYIDKLFGEATIQKNEVLKLIDTPEKAAIFLSELNNPARKFNIVNEDTLETTYIRNDYEGMLKLAESIASKTPKYYYIRKTRKTFKGRIYSELDKKDRDKKLENIRGSYRHYYVPIEDNKPEEVRQNPRIPIIKSIESIATVLNEKFGVPVHVINGDYINQELQTKEGKFYKKDINQSAKAFIVDGEIYVNTDAASVQDLFHEYTHLFLGVLKANNFKIYQQFLEYVSLYADFKNAMITKLRLYPNRSYYDLMEEVFADLYGEWIENNLPRDISKVFEYISSTEEVKATLFTVFDKTADGSNKGLQYLFGGRYLTTIWSRFNTDVSKMLSEKENLSFMRGKDLKLQRQLSNWIENQIRIYKELKAANPEKEDKDLEGIKEVCV